MGAPAPAPSPAAASRPDPSPSSPGAERFPLEQEPPADAAAAPSPRVVGAAPSPKPIAKARPTAAPGRPAAKGAADDQGFWKALVVAAVTAGKSAEEAIQLANDVISKG